MCIRDSYSTMGLGGASGEGSGGLLTPGGGPVITGMGGGMSNRALASGGDPNAMKAAVDQANAERVAAEKAARAAAQEQSLLTGRQTATSSGDVYKRQGRRGLGHRDRCRARRHRTLTAPGARIGAAGRRRDGNPT